MSSAVLKDSELLAGRALGQQYLRENKTEAYVSIPPALIITDSYGATWTIGFDYQPKGWMYFFNVLRNDVDTGEMAYKIEYQRGKVRIWTPTGWKTWVDRPLKTASGEKPGYWL